MFSSWKTSLDLLARLLKYKGIAASFIHGQVPISERRKILASFQNTNKGNVLLMTLGTGAVGLNLFTASRIHVIEPQWNPAVESQAIGRAVRLGQTRECTVIRYCKDLRNLIYFWTCANERVLVMEDTMEPSVKSNAANKMRIAELFKL